jgi:hypothetical protein
LKSLLVDPTNWQIMADSCPGMRPDVAVHTLEKHLKKIFSEQ